LDLSLRKLLRSFYNRKTTEVALDLLGKYLVYTKNGYEQIGKIVEVEAYVGPHDLACHASKGKTKRTALMFGPPGYSYIYLIYGIYHCLNVVTEEAGSGTAVLIRALEPIKNISLKTQGPGLLCKALQLDKQLNGYDLLSDDFYLAESENAQSFQVITKPRIGVAYAAEWAEAPLRFYIEGNPFVSKR